MVNPVTLNPMLSSRQPALKGQSRFAFCAALAMALTACAPLAWQKAGVSEDELKKTIDECREYARVASWQDANINAMNVPRVIVDPAGRAFVTQNNASGESDRFLVESDLTRACMERQGYTLKPVKPGKAK